MGKARETKGGKRKKAQEPDGVDSIRSMLVREIAARLKLDPAAIDPKASLTAYGLDSLEGVDLMVRFESVLGRRLDPTLIWQFPTIERLARRLAETKGAAVKRSR